MGWQDAPVVKDDSTSTNVGVDQLQAQGGKYTPDQMAAFDKARGQLLADAQNSGNDWDNVAPDPLEVSTLLNPTQKAAFQATTPAWQSAPVANAGNQQPAWQSAPLVPDQQTVMDKIKDKAMTALSMPIAGISGLAALASGEGLDKSVQRISDTSKQFTQHPGQFAEGVGTGIVGGLASGGVALKEIGEQAANANPLGRLYNAYMGNKGKTISQSLDAANKAPMQLIAQLPKAVQDELTSPASEAGQQFAGAPFEPFQAAMDYLGKHGAKTPADLALLTVLASTPLGIAALLKMKAKGVDIPKQILPDSVAEEATAQSALNKMGVNTTPEPTSAPTTAPLVPTDTNAVSKAMGVRPDQISDVPYEPTKPPTEAPPQAPPTPYDNPTPFENQAYTSQEGAGTPKAAPVDGIPFDTPTSPTEQAGLQIKGLIDKYEKSGVTPAKPPITFPEDQTGKQGELFSTENQAAIKTDQEKTAWQKYTDRVEAYQKAQAERDAKYSSDSFTPEQQSPSVEPISPLAAKKLGGTGRRGFGQGGAVNFGDMSDLQDRIDKLKASLQLTSRDRSTFQQGDTVRLMNGKVGVIQSISADGRYLVHGDGFKDSLPVQGIDYKYKPQGNAAEAYRKAGEIASNRPLGGVGKKGFGQGGAIRNIFNSKDPTLTPEEPKGVEVPLDDKDIVDTTYKQWNRSTDIGEFKEGLRIEKRNNPRFPQSVLDNADTLWDNFQNKGLRPTESNFGSMSNLNQRESSDTRPFEQMAAETKIGTRTVRDKETGQVSEVDRTLKDSPLKQSDDLSYITKEAFDPLHIISTNWSKPAGKVYNWAYSNLSDIQHQWTVKLGELMKFHEPFLNLPRKSQLRVKNAETYWDTNTNRQMLIDRGINWPTKDMLMVDDFTHLTSEEADAYLAHAKGYDLGYEAGGIDEPRQPGYMPHTWYGAWRVDFIHPETGLIEVHRTNYRWIANKYVKEAESRGLMAKISPPELSNKHDFVKNTQQMIQTANNLGKLGKAFARVLIDIQDGVMQGTITESLERKGIGGFLGEDGTRPESLMNPVSYIGNRMYNNKIMGVYEKAMNDFARAGKNRQIIEAVAKPFFQNTEKFGKTKQLTDAVKDLISTATGFNAQENIGFDRMIRQGFIKAGVSPNLPGNLLSALNTFARVERINSANLGFAAEHSLFALPGMFDLMRMHIERGITGEAQGSYAKALGAMARDTITFGMYKSAEGTRAAKWAADNGVYNSNYYDQMQYKSLGGKAFDLATHKALEVVVNRAKSVSFQMAYHYFKDIMPETQALQASKNHVKKTMQSFDALDTPELFKEGFVGKSLRPFNQIHLYNMARALEQVSAYVRNVKTNPVAAQKLLLPIMGLAGTYIMLGGAKGIAAHDDWNMLREWILDQAPDMENHWYLHSYEENIMNMGFPDWVTFGLVPILTHADIRGTFTSNFTNMFSASGLEAGAAGLKLLLQEAKKHFGGQADPEKIYANEHKLLPSTAIPWLEDAMAGDETTRLGGNIPEASKLNPTTPRTAFEDAYFKITGKRDITESMRNEKIKLQKEIEERRQKHKDYVTRNIVNNMIGFDTGSDDVSKMMDDATSANIGYDPQSLNKDIAKEIISRKLSSANQFILKAAQSGNMEKAAKFQTLLDTLHGEDLGK